MSLLMAIGVGVVVGAVYATGERSLDLGIKVAAYAAAAAFIVGNFL